MQWQGLSDFRKFLRAVKFFYENACFPPFLLVPFKWQKMVGFCGKYWLYREKIL
jgi:hypothetical protein